VKPIDDFLALLPLLIQQRYIRRVPDVRRQTARP
jgi:hypothetical protein